MQGAEDRLDAGIPHTMILRVETLDLYRERHPGIVAESRDHSNTTTLVADEIPIDLTLFDDRLVLPQVDAETGVISMLVDTDDPDALAWGERTFEACRENATPVSELDH